MPPVRPHERERDPKVVLLYEGVSQQVITARLPGHVADAENVMFSLVDGATRRAGTVIQQHLQDLDDGTDLLPAGVNRLHRIVRDATERYICIHNRTSAASTIRILDLSTNTWATVDQTLYGAAAQTYINSASPSEFRFRTLLDYTIILNTDVFVTASSKKGTITAATAANPTVITSVAHGLSQAPATGAITAISATAPTVITDVAHGLTTGQTVTVVGSDSVPKIDGTFHVRVIDVDHFEIPMIVTTAGTTGTWTRGELVVIDGSNTTPSIDGAWRVTVTGNDTFTIPVAVTTALTTGAAIDPCTWSYAQPDSSTMPAQLVRRNTSGSSASVNGLSAAITAVTAANPAVVTTANPHGLYTGQTVTIAGTLMVANQINGARVVRVLSATTFSVPVDTSGGVTTGTGSWTSQAYFQLDTIIWSPRGSGGPNSNPPPTLFAGTTKIADLREWRERIFLFGGQHILGGQAADLFNYFIEDVNAISDADPIDRVLSSDEVTDIDYAVTTQDVMLLFTKAGVQFILTVTGTAGLTPTSVQALPVTRYRTLRAEPAQMDPAVYYCTNNGDYLQVLEYIYDAVEPPRSADDVSGHVPTFVPLTISVPADLPGGTALPSTLWKMDASPEQGVVYLLRKDKLVSGEIFSRYLFAYKTRYIGPQKVQSAWTRFKFAGVRGIHDFVVVDKYLYALAHSAPPNTFTDGTISAISVANPTVLTSAAHGLVTGQTITIAGTNTNASTVGTFVVTVIDADHFSVPVNVAVVTTGVGTWILADFDFFILRMCLGAESSADSFPTPTT